MSNVKLENVRLLDPVAQIDVTTTVYLQNGQRVDSLDQIDEQIDAQGKWLMPTMVDLCARVREPGQQQHGTLKSEGKAARENGILHVITPPDSQPIVQDNGALIHGLIEKHGLMASFICTLLAHKPKGYWDVSQPIWQHLKRWMYRSFKCQCCI